MIYALAESAPAVFVMLCEADIVSMREGRTLYLDERHFQGRDINHVIVSLHATNEAAAELVMKAGGASIAVDPNVPQVGEAVCEGCKGVMHLASLFEGRCTVCWATEAKASREWMRPKV